MKIHNDVTHALQPADKSTTGKAGGTIAPKAVHAAPVDSVSISDVSRSLQAAGTSNNDAPFDVKRVEQIKAAISAGQFKVNPEKVADKVIDSASQLLTGNG